LNVFNTIAPPAGQSTNLLNSLKLKEVQIEGLVHPKMKIKSLITHPHAEPTP